MGINPSDVNIQNYYQFFQQEDYSALMFLQAQECLIDIIDRIRSSSETFEEMQKQLALLCNERRALFAYAEKHDSLFDPPSG